MVKYLESSEGLTDLVKEGKVLVDFYADWCGPCQMLAPILEEVDFIDIIKINIDKHQELAAKFGVMSIPTLVLMNNGEEVKRDLGFKNMDQIKKMVE